MPTLWSRPEPKSIRLKDAEWRFLKGLFCVLHMNAEYRQQAQRAFPLDALKQSWVALDRRQALRDAVHSFKYTGAIEDYDLSAETITYRGYIFEASDIPKRYTVKFTPEQQS